MKLRADFNGCFSEALYLSHSDKALIAFLKTL
jgi:hypothetical protein